MNRAEYRSSVVAHRHLEVTAEQIEAAQIKMRKVFHALPIMRVAKRQPSALAKVARALGII